MSVCLFLFRWNYLPLLLPCPHLLLPSLYLRAPPSTLQSTLSLIPLPRPVSPLSLCTLLDTRTRYRTSPLLRPLILTLRKPITPLLFILIPPLATTKHLQPFPQLALMRTPLLSLILTVETDAAARLLVQLLYCTRKAVGGCTKVSRGGSTEPLGRHLTIRN